MSAHAQPQDYARAIHGLALEGWIRQLRGVQEALSASSALRAAAADGSVPAAERLRHLDAALAPERLSEGVRKALGTLMDAGQIDLLGAILMELEHLSKPRAERRVARVTSAVQLTGTEQATIRDRLTTKFGADLEFQFDVDPALIGGVVLRVGDRVMDGSVAAKLAAMRDRLTA